MSVFLFSPPGQANAWSPAVDVYRTAWGWILKFDLAGVGVDDVHVHVSKRTVTVSGVRRDSFLEEAGCRYYSMEIVYSRFERTIELPEDLERARVHLDSRDGILFVRISVKEENSK